MGMAAQEISSMLRAAQSHSPLRVGCSSVSVQPALPLRCPHSLVGCSVRVRSFVARCVSSGSGV